jgi:hypothetical protein
MLLGWGLKSLIEVYLIRIMGSKQLGPDDGEEIKADHEDTEKDQRALCCKFKKSFHSRHRDLFRGSNPDIRFKGTDVARS